MEVKHKLGELSMFHGVHKLYYFSDITAVSNGQVLGCGVKEKLNVFSVQESSGFWS